MSATNKPQTETPIEKCINKIKMNEKFISEMQNK